MPHERFAGFRSKSRKTRTPGANHCAAAIANLGAMNQPMEPNKPKRLRGVIDAARLTQRFCEQKIGWGRIGVVLSVTIIAIAAYVLYKILRGIDFKEVVQALVSTQPRDIMLAALFVAGGYFTLTFYDLFALRTIGRHDVPYRVAALGGFTSYSIGHNVGASVFTGGAVRYRVYSAWGLDAIEVAKLCFIAGLTFWLGNATVLGLGIAYVPDGLSAINQLPNWFNRLLAFATLCVLALYVAWVWTGQRVVGRDGWQVTLPGGPLTLLQIGIGIVDLTFCAFAMYMLMPDEPHIGFVTLAVIFVSATLLGFASHSPGGIGVFDAAMLVALWQYHKADLLAGLLLFRLLYYIAPFALSLAILGIREIVLGVTAPDVPHVEELMSDVLSDDAKSRKKPAGKRDGRR
jgi:glycosyltransferase 2 family protein